MIHGKNLTGIFNIVTEQLIMPASLALRDGRFRILLVPQAFWDMMWSVSSFSLLETKLPLAFSSSPASQ